MAEMTSPVSGAAATRQADRRTGGQRAVIG